MKTVISALRIVFSHRQYRVVAGICLAVALPLYLMTLPASRAGGLISVRALAFLDAQLVGFSVVLATLVALLGPLMIYLLRAGRRSAKSSATGGLVIGLLAPMLCCSPILPIGIGFIAALLPALGATLGTGIQRFFALHQTELLLLSVLLLVVALYQNARQVPRTANCSL